MSPLDRLFGIVCDRCVREDVLPPGWRRGTGVVGGPIECENCGRSAGGGVVVQYGPSKPAMPPRNPSNVLTGPAERRSAVRWTHVAAAFVLLAVAYWIGYLTGYSIAPHHPVARCTPATATHLGGKIIVTTVC